MYLAKFIPGYTEPFVTEVADYELKEGRLVPREQYAKLLPTGEAVALRATRVDAIASAKCKLVEAAMIEERIEQRAKLKC